MKNHINKIKNKIRAAFKVSFANGLLSVLGLIISLGISASLIAIIATFGGVVLTFALACMSVFAIYKGTKSILEGIKLNKEYKQLKKQNDEIKQREMQKQINRKEKIMNAQKYSNSQSIARDDLGNEVVATEAPNYGLDDLKEYFTYFSDEFGQCTCDLIKGKIIDIRLLEERKLKTLDKEKKVLLDRKIMAARFELQDFLNGLESFKTPRTYETTYASFDDVKEKKLKKCS